MATGADFFAQLEKRFNQLPAEEKLDKIVEYQKKLTALKEQGLSEEEAVARLESELPLPVFGVERISDAETVYLRVKSVDDPAFAHILLVATMFEGDVPLRIRIADTGKLWGGTCIDHPAFLQECREWLGDNNVVIKLKEQTKLKEQKK